MTTVVSQNLEIVAGDTDSYEATFEDESGQLIDDPGATYTLAAKFAYTDVAPTIQIDASQDSAGKATLTIPGSMTRSYARKTVFLYDVSVKESNGVVTTIVEGLIIIKPAIHPTS